MAGTRVVFAKNRVVNDCRAHCEKQSIKQEARAQRAVSVLIRTVFLPSSFPKRTVLQRQARSTDEFPRDSVEE